MILYEAKGHACGFVVHVFATLAVSHWRDNTLELCVCVYLKELPKFIHAHDMPLN